MNHHRPQLDRPLQFVLLACLAVSFGTVYLFGESQHEVAQMGAMEFDLPNSGWLVVAGILLVVLFNALFVACEAAVSLLKPLHVRHVVEQNAAKGERLQGLLDHRAKYAAACRFGSDVARLMLLLLVLVLAPGITTLLSPAWNGEATYLTTILVAAVMMVPVGFINLIAELVPRSYAGLHPHGVASRLHKFILATTFLLGIPAGIATGLANVFTTRFGGKASYGLANQAEEEIKTLAETAEQSGEIEQDERELIHSVFEFTDTVAREVMTPRVAMDAMPVSSAPEEVLQVIRDSGHSRIPLYEGTDDQIVGIIHAKDLFLAMLDSKTANLRTLMRPAMFVPENKDLHELLQEMRQSRGQLAVVQDEFGGTAGVVTIEDIVEELVGDIVDEYDKEEPPIVEAAGGWVVDGMLHLDDLNEAIGSAFESDEFDTIGGYVFGRFGRQPSQGESLDDEGYRFTVEATDGRRILTLRLCPDDDTTD